MTITVAIVNEPKGIPKLNANQTNLRGSLGFLPPNFSEKKTSADAANTNTAKTLTTA